MSMDKAGYVSVGAEIEDEVMPDRVVFSICFGGGFDTKEACLDDYNEDRAKVAAALAPFGLDDELTCRGYTCYARTTRRKATITGYSYRAYGTIAVLLDDIDVAAVWTALNTCGSRADMTVGFDLADQRAAEDALIARAVERARSNAQALAAASGSRLGGVKHISYNSGLGCMDRLCYASAGGLALEAPAGSGDFKATVLEPEPIEVECSVDVEWWLE